MPEGLTYVMQRRAHDAAAAAAAHFEFRGRRGARLRGDRLGWRLGERIHSRLGQLRRSPFVGARSERQPIKVVATERSRRASKRKTN